MVKANLLATETPRLSAENARATVRLNFIGRARRNLLIQRWKAHLRQRLITLNETEVTELLSAAHGPAIVQATAWGPMKIPFGPAGAVKEAFKQIRGKISVKAAFLIKIIDFCFKDYMKQETSDRQYSKT